MRKLLVLAVMSAAVALGAACSSSTNGATETDDSCSNCTGGDDSAPAKDGGSDATLDGSSCPVQSYPPLVAACPTTYSTSYAGQLCGPVDTQCYYPGRGDISANGCAAAAMLMCEPPDAGVGEIPDAAIFDDAGDASVGYWTFAQ